MYHNNIKRLLQEKGVTLELLSKELGIGIFNARRKMNSPGLFLWSEISRICVMLDIDNPLDEIDINTEPENEEESEDAYVAKQAAIKNSDPLLIAHRRMYMKIYTRCKIYTKLPEAIIRFREESREIRNDYKNGRISGEEFGKWIKEAEHEYLV